MKNLWGKNVYIFESKIKKLIRLIKQVSDEMLEYYLLQNQAFQKNDDSIFTQADIKSHEIICDFLKKEFNFPIISEENTNFVKANDHNIFWCIDR